MASFLCDENLGRTFIRGLTDQGLEATAWRDVGEAGAPDDEVFEYARSNGHVLLTRDLDFSNIHRFPVGTHEGIVICRYPMKMTPDELARHVGEFLLSCEDEVLKGNLVVLSPGGARFRVHE